MYTYQQSTGELRQNGQLESTGYSGGNCGKNPEGKNNPDMQGVKNVGPIVRGLYTMGAPVEHSQLGPYAIPLTPDPSNDMLERGNFYVHGDTISSPGNASEGCVILPRNIRESMILSGDLTLEVVA
jgi:hypothetical protein